jgi:tartrate dehydratase beta subunit/fumarate hydratase class I family protein
MGQKPVKAKIVSIAPTTPVRMNQLKSTKNPSRVLLIILI